MWQPASRIGKGRAWPYCFARRRKAKHYTTESKDLHMPMEAVAQYLSTTFVQTEGWCSPHLWQAIQPLSDFQNSKGVTNPIAEIGVYHGKFFIGLMKTRPGGTHYAIDSFGKHVANLDRAGDGDLEILKVNIAMAGEDLNSVVFLQCDSMSITHGEIDTIRAITGGFSMFSVDGCHIAAHTINEFRIAMELTIPEGIIFVDDYCNPDWPGVQEGMAKLYFHDDPRFIPLLFTSSKLVCCHISHHRTLLNLVKSFVEQNFPDTTIKAVRRFGYDTLNLYPNRKTAKYLAAKS
jgi:hypothetical protein